MGPFDVLWLTATVRLSTPLLFAATGELVAERTGILNIGLEGMMLMGAFFSFLGAHLTGSVVIGIVVGAGAGAALAAVMAVLAIQARADQIVVGVGLNLLAAGLTTFTFREVFADQGEVVLDRPGPLQFPLLSDIPVVGPALFRQSALVYIAFVTVGVAWFLLYRTSWGLAIRAAGEVPASADTAGISVVRTRWMATLASGGLAGVAGAFLSVGQTGLFVEGMSGGRGFLALAAVIFGGWRPLGVLGACLAFGAADALQLRIQAEETVPAEVWLAVAVIAVGSFVFTQIPSRGVRRRTSGLVTTVALAAAGTALFVVAPAWRFPAQLWLTLPYVAALLALAGLVRRVRMPASLAVPYRRGGEG
jgi:simple sugar transport system permease protein